jgi:hypothetical protein
VCGTARIDVDEFPQTVRCVVRRDQAALEVFQCLPFGVERVGITDGSEPARLARVSPLASVSRMAARRLPIGRSCLRRPGRTLWRPSRSSDDTCAITEPVSRTRTWHRDTRCRAVCSRGLSHSVEEDK